MTDFTRTFRRTTYPAIEPANPANTQTGRTVLVVGASEGIGFGIAQAYAEAGAKEVILTSRSQAKLDAAKHKIEAGGNVTSKITSVAFDASDVPAIESFWNQLSHAGSVMDILILSAAASDNMDERDPLQVAKFFEFNVTSRLHMIHHFQHQKADASRHKILIDVSSAGLHCYPYPRPAYSASKAGLTNYLCHLADNIKESEMRIINYHPGAVYTEAARRAGEIPEDLAIWDHPSLSAHVGLWLSTPAAAFLHGRYVWANWDVEDLVAMKQEILDDPTLLKVGITGVSGFTVAKLMAKGKEVPAPRAM